MISIAFYHKILSRLFGGEPEEETQAGQETPSQQDPGPPPPAPRELTLPQDHPIRQLWSIHALQAKRLPQPLLRLTDPPDMPLTDQEAEKELARLQGIVSSSARDRLARLDSGGASDLDAQTVVLTAASGMAAWLLVYPPEGQGAEVDRAMLDRALKESKVSWGVDEALLDILPQDPERYFHLFLCAWGKSAVQGVDGKVVDLFPRVLERSVTVDENNRVDYTTLNFFQNVNKGDVICRLIPPTRGVEGRTVTNQSIPARDGRAATLPKGRHTEISADGSSLLASSSGHVEFSGRAFQVKPLLDIPANVDFSTGDINFLGDVCIHGDICSGFTVRAIGNITVGGVVEACTVEAGGDLVVSGGVQGDNQAVIRAQRSIFAKFIENSCVYVKESLHADCLINCDVYCDGDVEVRSGRMTIIGGTLRAAQSVSAGIVGSRAECRTEVFLGGQPCADFECHILRQEIKQLEKDLEKTERQPDSPDKLGRMSKMRMQLMINQKKLAQLDKERELAAGEQEDQSPCRLTCTTVYPGTVLRIDEAAHQFDRRLSPCTAALADGEIRLQ